ncbi:MAG: hypothetical protein K2N64_07575 [Anaeroplasmataceae bacterium]|nr:hypothetical protein [Anaeroplasmataceae bacterium]
MKKKEIKKGTIISSTDDKLVTNKDQKKSNKNRLLAVTSVNKKTEDLTAMKIYTHNSKTTADEVEVVADPKLSKKSVFGKHIITHEEVKEKGNTSVKRLNKKNGNIKVTEHTIEEKNINEAISKLSKREKRKLERHK